MLCLYRNQSGYLHWFPFISIHADSNSVSEHGFWKSAIVQAQMQLKAICYATYEPKA